MSIVTKDNIYIEKTNNFTENILLLAASLPTSPSPALLYSLHISLLLNSKERANKLFWFFQASGCEDHHGNFLYVGFPITQNTLSHELEPLLQSQDFVLFGNDLNYYLLI